MTTTEKEWEKEARELSECADVMPRSLKEHQNKIYNACLDMAYKFDSLLLTQKQEIAGQIENMPIFEVDTDFNDGGDDEYRNRQIAVDSAKRRGYRQALSDALEIIKS